MCEGSSPCFFLLNQNPPTSSPVPVLHSTPVEVLDTRCGSSLPYNDVSNINLITNIWEENILFFFKFRDWKKDSKNILYIYTDYTNIELIQNLWEKKAYIHFQILHESHFQYKMGN